MLDRNYGIPQIEDVFAVHGSRRPAPVTVAGAVIEEHGRIDASGAVLVALGPAVSKASSSSSPSTASTRS